MLVVILLYVVTVLSLPVCGVSNVGVHVAFYTVRFIPKLVPGLATQSKTTRHVKFSYPCRDLCEGDRQKILLHQVFNRCDIVWGRHQGLSSTPHLLDLTDLGRDFLDR